MIKHYLFSVRLCRFDYMYPSEGEEIKIIESMNGGDPVFHTRPYDWIEANCAGEAIVTQHIDAGLVFAFERKDDATLFQITFGGLSDLHGTGKRS